MGDKFFPRSIKPLTNKTYSLSRGSNVFETSVQGGVPRTALNYTLEPVPFVLNFILSDMQFQVVLQFYDITINHGANSFKMMLDSGTGIVEHQCYIKPNSFKANRPSHNNWYLAITMIAEVTPSQNEVCDNLYQLWDCYGTGSCAIINSLEDFAFTLPPNDIIVEPLSWILGIDGQLKKKLTGEVTWDRATTATYIDGFSDLLKTAGIDTPRFNGLGWVMEGDGTNSILPSDDFSDAAYTKDNSSVDANVVNSPDGTLNADNIIQTLANGSLKQIIAVASDTEDRTSIIFIKQNTAPTCRLRVQYSGGTSVTTDKEIDFSTIDNDSTIKSMADGWYMVQVSATNNNTNTSCRLTFFPDRSDSGLATYAWRGQLQDSLFATSAIKTLTTPVTRLHDGITIPVTSNLPLLSQPWTFYTEVYLDGLPPGNTALWGASITDDQRIFVTQLGSLKIKDSVGTVNLAFNGKIKTQTKQEVVIVFDGVNVTCFIDGAEELTAAATFTDIEMGDSLVGSSIFGENLFGTQNDMQWYDKVLTLTQINQLPEAVE